jgi:hypothetical protein
MRLLGQNSVRISDFHPLCILFRPPPPWLHRHRAGIQDEVYELWSSSQTTWKVRGNITLEKAGIELGASATTTVYVSMHRVIKKSLCICKTTDMYSGQKSVNRKERVQTSFGKLNSGPFYISRVDGYKKSQGYTITWHTSSHVRQLWRLFVSTRALESLPTFNACFYGCTATSESLRTTTVYIVPSCISVVSLCQCKLRPFIAQNMW